MSSNGLISKEVVASVAISRKFPAALRQDYLIIDEATW
jgi:hypothetical protein